MVTKDIERQMFFGLLGKVTPLTDADGNVVKTTLKDKTVINWEQLMYNADNIPFDFDNTNGTSYMYKSFDNGYVKLKLYATTGHKFVFVNRVTIDTSVSTESSHSLYHPYYQAQPVTGQLRLSNTVSVWSGNTNAFNASLYIAELAKGNRIKGNYTSFVFDLTAMGIADKVSKMQDFADMFGYSSIDAMPYFDPDTYNGTYIAINGHLYKLDS